MIQADFWRKIKKLAIFAEKFQGGHFSGKPGNSLESQNASGKPGKPGILEKCSPKSGILVSF